ncbi:beta strand repeat-containing protein [Fimbriiglobus ruber]|uniref:beta strand repeat-containing protein n=1 Tax=Fimbriiglobus ruber TaxID=1908690 RepID=UPI00117B53E4|nr:PKD domain-containing protein [Fimbriiglobus ruber]
MFRKVLECLEDRCVPSVYNPQPVPLLTAVEGTTLSGGSSPIVATFASSDPLAGLSATVNWLGGPASNDGSATITLVGSEFVPGVGTVPQYSVSQPTTFGATSGALQPQFGVTINDATDSTNAQIVGAFQVTDAPLTAGAAVPPTTVTEGFVVASSAQLFDFTDGYLSASPGDFTATVDWGDGTPISTGVVGQFGPGSFFVSSGGHVYATPGTYTITVTVQDNQPDGSQIQSMSGAITVNEATVTNVTAPAVSAVVGAPLTNVVVATFTVNDPLAQATDFGATVTNWGDGTSSPGTVVETGTTAVSSQFSVLSSHAYTAPLTGGTIAVSIQNLTAINPVSSATATTAVDVAAATLAPTAAPVVVQEGTTVPAGTPFGSFIDNGGVQPGVTYTATATVNGTAVPLTVTQTGGDDFTLTATAATTIVAGLDAGISNYTLTVSNNNGASVTTSGQFTVTDAPLTAGATVLQTGNTGIPLSGLGVGSFTDGNPVAPVSDFTATIDWGDGAAASTGTISQPGGVGTPFDVSGSHTYAKPGVYTVTTHVVDDGGSTATLTATVTITDLAVTGSAKSFTAVEGQNIGQVVLTTFDDPNTLATVADVTATLAVGGWGDGTPSAAGVTLAVQQIGVDPANGDPIFQIVGSHTYAEETAPGSPDALNVLVTTRGGVTTALTTGSVTVHDASLTGSAGNTITGIAGNPTGTAVLGTFVDANPAATAADFTAGGGSVVVTWGDGSAPQTLAAADLVEIGTPGGNAWVINAAHTYAEAGTYAYTVTVTDAGGSATLITGSAVVADAALTAGASVPQAGNTGVPLTGINVGSFTDGNPVATTTDFTDTIDWGDGTAASAGAISQPGGVGTSFSVSGNHTYATPGVYTVTTVVVDDDGKTTTLTATVTITDLPVTGSTKSFSAVEGQNTGSFVLATFDDPNTLATVSDVSAQLAVGGWGDGTPAAAGVTLTVQQIGVDPANGEPIFQVLGSHTYAEETAGVPDALSVIITTRGGVTTTLTSPAGGGVTVHDAPLTGSAGNTITGTEGNPTGTAVLGTFVDANPTATVADFTTGGGSVVVTWGDGSAPQTLAAANLAAIGAPGGVTWTISAAHTYAEAGTYAYTVTVTDAGGSATTVAGSAVVAAVADATLTAGASVPQAGNTGIPLDGIGVGSFTDGNPGALSSEFTTTIDWGDGTAASAGTISQPGGVGTSFSVGGNHTYAKPGVYTVTTTVTDDDGKTTTFTATFTITDLPVTGATKSFSAVEGQNTGSFVLATFDDPNTLATVSDVSAQLAVGGWGDGTPAAAGVTLAVQQIGVDPANGDPIFQVVGSHTYAGETPAGVPDTLGVIITTRGGVTTTLTSPAGGGVTVHDAPLTGSAGNTITGTEGNPTGTAVLGTFVDANPAATAADFTAGGGSVVVTWGDGSAPQTLTAANLTISGMTWTISAAHTYAEAGTYAYTVTVTDAGGSAALVTGSAVVTDAALTAGASVPQTGTTNVPLVGINVGSFTDGNPEAGTGDFTGTVNWGDGSTNSAASFAEVSGVFNVTGNHTYTTPGVYTVTTNVVDDDGSKTTLTATFTITNLPAPGSTIPMDVPVAIGDFTGSGKTYYAVGTGPGPIAEVNIVDSATGKVIFSVQPFGTFTGGVYVTAGDIYNNGTDALVITPNQGGGPRVEVYEYINGAFVETQNFFALNNPAFRGGARAAVGDINHDGYGDLVVAAGYGGGPVVEVYDGKSMAVQGQQAVLIPDFFAFDSSLRNGVYVAAGDVNGDGYADIIIGAGPGGGPRVMILSGASLLSQGATAAENTPIANFFAGDISNRDGIGVGVANLDGDQYADVLTGTSQDNSSQITASLGVNLAAGVAIQDTNFEGYPDLPNGVFVG